MAVVSFEGSIHDPAMARDSLSPQKAQLDTAEREHLEDIVADMRDRVEDNVRFQLAQEGLDEEPEDPESLTADARQLVEAIELEAADGEGWDDGFERYVTGVGYTIVNRLAALRCLEVRGFVDEEVTVFTDTGLTPAAETLVHEEFLLEDEAILQAYYDACDDLAAEIEILFDRETTYSHVDPDADTFADLCGLLDEIPADVWRADDVLGWVYEYYNVKLLDDLRRKGDREGLAPADVPPANQFYTPHWVVRMLTDNSLGKLYLEHTGELQDAVEAQRDLSPADRKDRPLAPDDSPDVADFCTYLVPAGEGGEPTAFDHPSELRIIDPACGSGHFLLYAFDVLERIWRAETDVDPAAIPRKVIRHNLYGVDLDLRACQLAAFNLYVKGRERAEAEGADGFDMPAVGIVCADATMADVDGVEAVFAEVADGKPEIADALHRVLDAFEEIHGLGSLLDVRGTLGDLFEDEGDAADVQLTDDPREDPTLGQVLHSVREAVDEQRDEESFLARDLRSFVRLLDVLAQDYDVALMNPPYGAQGRMPDAVESYVDDAYDYGPEFYINFYEVGRRIVRSNGRIGMLVPRSFMFKRSFEDFRRDFLREDGTFDFLAEYGLGVLDNATVRTVGTVVRQTASSNDVGTYLRLHDQDAGGKEETFLREILGDADGRIDRTYRVSQSEFTKVPGMPISYWTPDAVRDLHVDTPKLDAGAAGIDGTSVCTIATGLQTGNNPRFIRKHWEVEGLDGFRPLTKGSSDAWIRPTIDSMLRWGERGEEIRSVDSSVVRNEQHYGKEALTWNHIKETGRRFGYCPPGGVFDQTGSVVLPGDDVDGWSLLGVVNSTLYHSLFLSFTPDRHWNPGDVGRIPWGPEVDQLDGVAALTREMYAARIRESLTDPTSPVYVGPTLLPSDATDGFYFDHPQQDAVREVAAVSFDGQPRSRSITAAARRAEVDRRRRENRLHELADEVDERLFDELAIPDETREAIRTEIALRTATDPRRDRTVDPEAVPEVPDTLDRQVKDLVHHFAMDAVREAGDGIVPLREADDQRRMLDRVVDRFHDAYGEHAPDRLVEVDEILGTASATDEAYPNLRAFVEDDLFDYHVDRMDGAPILWKLTTSRLVSDADGEGFACFVDYHRLDGGLFDRLTNRYLEPRKATLRERRSAANRRRSDESLDASERAAAADEYDRCASALDQIAVFKDVLQDLGATTERACDAETRDLARRLASKVETFRAETETRLEALAALRETKSEAWFADTFSPGFWDKVERWREEWVAALEELEAACEEYAKPADEPVAAHAADRFAYFTDRIKGSDHYSSSGILFTTYYFEREGAAFLDEDGEPNPDRQDEYAEHLATLAAGLDDYKALADEISDGCEALANAAPDDWATRARSEITTAGYRPNHAHGVAINLTPLADATIVPRTVEDDVL